MRGCLAAALAEEAVGVGATALEIRSRPPGARVVVDGTPVGVTDLRYGVYPGDHRVRLELEGHDPLDTTASVRQGEIRLLELDLSPSEGTHERRPFRTWSFLSFAGGALALGAGATLMAIDQPADEGGHLHPTSVDTLAGGLAAVGAGAALVATGIVLWRLDHRRAHPRTVVAPAAGGVVVGGSF